ncbi:MAG: hypothetical protein RJB17_1555 [Pseudomonadota bacterium]|jgi:uncharacterized protein YciI
MLYVVLLTDQPNHDQVRADHLQAHIDWLERHKDVIQVGGSLRREPSETPKGGLWIAQADSKQIIDELLQTDPFYIAGLRQSYEILHWSKANNERHVLI